MLGLGVAEQYGGGGTGDFRFDAVLIEELNRVGAQAVTMGLSGFNDRSGDRRHGQVVDDRIAVAGRRPRRPAARRLRIHA
ncbi:hypothetical protein [Nocardia speluncae]|uniref:hypothetical protein n=1 Tax=Nocardia speluncae TaxID=419477 RepID=UPI0024801C9B|nr:hypothetical protein [Nocardia speluncae]